MEDHYQELRHHTCKFCSKSFGCGRSLGGHMRSHMINDTSAQSDGSKITRKKLPPLSTYLMSNPTNNKKKKRSNRRRTKYTGPVDASSISLANNASSSASEVDQEQEEVALCLILLSRDVGQWVGLNSLASESSDEEDQAGDVVSDSCNHLIKRKSIDSFDPEPKPDKLKKFKALNGEGGSIKFDCTTCNKAFHSYQALGGHRESHKKTKGCFASKIGSCENGIDTESSPDRTSDSNKLTNEVQTDQMLVMDRVYRVETSNMARKSKGHECPICLKVFPSGQALGGHKRAHLVGVPNVLHHQAPQEPIILDLNLPAPVEQENKGLVGFNPWWLGRSNNNCESLLGLIFN